MYIDILQPQPNRRGIPLNFSLSENNWWIEKFSGWISILHFAINSKDKIFKDNRATNFYENLMYYSYYYKLSSYFVRKIKILAYILKLYQNCINLFLHFFIENLKCVIQEKKSCSTFEYFYWLKIDEKKKNWYKFCSYFITNKTLITKFIWN